jgi:hypothetical protein
LELVGQRDLRLIWVDRLRWIADEARRQSGDERREHKPTAARGEILKKQNYPLEIFDFLRRQLQSKWMAHSRASVCGAVGNSQMARENGILQAETKAPKRRPSRNGLPQRRSAPTQLR